MLQISMQKFCVYSPCSRTKCPFVRPSTENVFNLHMSFLTPSNCFLSPCVVRRRCSPYIYVHVFLMLSMTQSPVNTRATERTPQCCKHIFFPMEWRNVWPMPGHNILDTAGCWNFFLCNKFEYCPHHLLINARQRSIVENGLSRWNIVDHKRPASNNNKWKNEVRMENVLFWLELGRVSGGEKWGVLSIIYGHCRGSVTTRILKF